MKIRHLGKHIVADQEVSCRSIRKLFFRRPDSEEFHQGWNTFLARGFRYVCRRLYTQDGYSMLGKILEKISIVAGEFYGKRVWSQSEPVRRHSCIRLGMLQPAIGVRREISIFRKNVIRTDILVELDEHALVAHIHDQRKERLHFVQLILAQDTFAKRLLT